MRTLRTRFLLAACAGMATLGCQNPGSVRQIATSTAANVTTIESGIRRLAGQSEQVWEARSRNVARQHGVVTSLRADYELDRELVRKTGANADAIANELARWSKKIVETYQKADGAEERMRDQLLAQRTALEQRRQALSAVARNLAELGDEESFKDRLGFLGGYLAEVGKEVKTRQDASEKAGAAAKADVETKATAANALIGENADAKEGGS